MKPRDAERLAVASDPTSGVDFDAMLYGSGRPGVKSTRGFFACGNLLEGTDGLEIRCLKNGRFVSATYRLPSLGNVNEIRALIMRSMAAEGDAREGIITLVK